MTNNYNQRNEIALRILLLLSIIDEPKTVDVIATFDLIITYGKYFQLSNSNLHGENPYYLAELTSRRILINNAIKFLVRNNFIQIYTTNNGLSYKINKKGISYVNKANSSYSKEYKMVVQNLKKYLKEYTDEQIVEKVSLMRRKWGK